MTPSSHRRTVAAMLLLGIVTGAGAGAIEPPAGVPPVATLKATYLVCDREASQRQLTFSEAAACSTAGEQLLQTEFGGDFNRLLAWWRSAKHAAPQAGEPVDLARR